MEGEENNIVKMYELPKTVISPIEDIEFSNLKVGDFFELVGERGYPLIEMNITSIKKVGGKQIIEGDSNNQEKIIIQYDPELSQYTLLSEYTQG